MQAEIVIPVVEEIGKGQIVRDQVAGIETNGRAGGGTTGFEIEVLRNGQDGSGGECDDESETEFREENGEGYENDCSDEEDRHVKEKGYSKNQSNGNRVSV